MSKEELQEMIDAHWGYVGSTLLAHKVAPADILVAEYHYKSAAHHFWKHAKEDSALKGEALSGEGKTVSVTVPEQGCHSCGWLTGSRTICSIDSQCHLFSRWKPK